MMFNYVYHYLFMHFYLGLPMFTRVYHSNSCFHMFSPVYLSFPMFTSVYQCLPQLTRVYLCLTPFTHACLPNSCSPMFCPANTH